MKKKLRKFDFRNTKKIEETETLNVLMPILSSLNLPRRLLAEELISIVPNNFNFENITPLQTIIPEEETTVLYTVLNNEDGWYAKDIYESTFIKIHLKPLNFLEK